MKPIQPFNPHFCALKGGEEMRTSPQPATRHRDLEPTTITLRTSISLTASDIEIHQDTNVSILICWPRIYCSVLERGLTDNHR